MNFWRFLKDKFYVGILFFLCYGIFLLLFLAFRVNLYLILCVFFLSFFFLGLSFLIEYFRKKNFYCSLEENVARLDKAYLVLETLNKPEFYEGEIFWDILYDINKSMCDVVNNLEKQQQDLKDYIEMWIHDVKWDKKVLEQVRRIEVCVEQVLYFARSENASQDYLIKNVNLSKVINDVALKNKDDLLSHNISLFVENALITVLTDSKWLCFILEQIINNCIKYVRSDVDSYIKISVNSKKQWVKLCIEDNGLGISSQDLPRVFDKTYTGMNGHICSTSTGMGLFIVKNLCEKLGHRIEIESEVNKYTRVIITFFESDYYKGVKQISSKNTRCEEED